MDAQQIWSGRQLAEFENAGLVGDRKSGGAAKRGDHRTIKRLSKFVGNFALDETRVGSGDLGHGFNAETLRRDIGRLRCQEAKHDRDD